MKKIRIYLASPFFNDAERATVKSIEELVSSIDTYELWSPSRDGTIVTPDMNHEQRQSVVQENIFQIRGSDLVIAVVDNRDPGTFIEFGGAAFYGIPIVTYSGQGHGVNVMIAGLAIGHANDIEHLKLMLKDLRSILKLPVGSARRSRYLGDFIDENKFVGEVH